MPRRVGVRLADRVRQHQVRDHSVWRSGTRGVGQGRRRGYKECARGLRRPKFPGSEWIPSRDGAGPPNGQPISDVFSRAKFFVGNQARLRGGNHPADPKLDSIRLTSLKSFQDRMNPICLCL